MVLFGVLLEDSFTAYSHQLYHLPPIRECTLPDDFGHGSKEMIVFGMQAMAMNIIPNLLQPFIADEHLLQEEDGSHEGSLVLIVDLEDVADDVLDGAEELLLPQPLESTHHDEYYGLLGLAKGTDVELGEQKQNLLPEILP